MADAVTTDTHSTPRTRLTEAGLILATLGVAGMGQAILTTLIDTALLGSGGPWGGRATARWSAALGLALFAGPKQDA